MSVGSCRRAGTWQPAFQKLRKPSFPRFWYALQNRAVFSSEKSAFERLRLLFVSALRLHLSQNPTPRLAWQYPRLRPYLLISPRRWLPGFICLDAACVIFSRSSGCFRSSAAFPDISSRRYVSSAGKRVHQSLSPHKDNRGRRTGEAINDCSDFAFGFSECCKSQAL